MKKYCNFTIFYSKACSSGPKGISTPNHCFNINFSTTIQTKHDFNNFKMVYLLLPKVIDASKSLVNMMATKIEVLLKKAEPMSWARLDLPPPPKDKEKEKDVDSEDECDD